MKFEGWTHGTASTYGAGCRCPDCLSAWKDYDRHRLGRLATYRAVQRLKRRYPGVYRTLYEEEAEGLGIRVGRPGRPRTDEQVRAS